MESAVKTPQAQTELASTELQKKFERLTVACTDQRPSLWCFFALLSFGGTHFASGGFGSGSNSHNCIMTLLENKWWLQSSAFPEH
jgi:hypothetical protein